MIKFKKSKNLINFPKIALKCIQCVLVLSLVVSFSHFLNYNRSIAVEAASTGFASGTVSLDKYYLNGTSEVKSLITAPGDYVTVRLKYNNTGLSSATNVVLNDSLPSAKFTYITGSLKNCLINDQNCAALSDSLFTGVNLTTAPSVGFYGQVNNSVSGNLELGRFKYVHITTCSQISGQNESFIQSVDNASIFVPSCSSVSGSSTVVSYSSSSILGQRYVHQTVCIYLSGEKEIFTQSIDNNSSFTPSCSNFSGSAVDSSQTLDLLANRYLHQVVCTQSSGEKEIFTQSVDNLVSFTPSCSNLGGSASVLSSLTVDLSSTSNGSGYIEYQMKSEVVENYNSASNVDIGDYGINPTLSSTDFTTLSDPMTNSLSLKVYCDTITPTGGQRNLSLSDAELRAGQDFTCNYQAKICPIVFEDINVNGKYDTGVDTLTSSIQVQLKSQDGNTTYSIITTNGSAQCFENLLHGRTYSLNIPTPPSGDNTTGGNSQTKLITYETTQFNVNFGYTNGSLVLNVPSVFNLPAITVSSKETATSVDITPIQVIDTRLANPGWTLTATIQDFVSTTDNNVVIPISSAFRNIPGSVQVNSGPTNGINIGQQKTVNSTSDIMTIFAATPGFSRGDYQISTNIRLTVPPFSRSTSYQTNYIYTLF
ncbi:MAG: SdrD B-like domain-containing protein [bacterium]